jgi:Tfp pilus assembly protein PilX
MVRALDSRRRSSRRHPDAGMSLVLTVMTGAFALALTLTVVTSVIVTTRDSGLDRQRSVAVSAAEAGIDAAYAALQSSGATLPCRWPASGSLNAMGTDATQVVATITYFRADGSPITCTGGTVSEQPFTAEIVSTAQTTALGGGSTRGVRTMQALVNLHAAFSNALTDAIFADGNLTFANYSSLAGQTGKDANVYSNDSVFCQNGNSTTVFNGNWIAQGSVSLSNQCEITGDVWARGSVSLNNNMATIDGYVRTSNGTFYGVPEAHPHAMVGKLVQAPAPVAPQTLQGQISWDTCWTDSNRTTLANPPRCEWPATVPAPPAKPFPIIRGDATAQAAWAADGYTVIKDTDPTMDPQCNNPDSDGRNWITNWLISHASLLTGKTMLVVSCPGKELRFQNMGNQEINLNNDLAIFAYNGFVTAGRTVFGSADGAGHTFHMVVPYDATASPTNCWGPTVTMDNQTAIKPILTTLIYTPCGSYMANNAEFNGQIFGGGDISVNNQFTMQFTQVPMPAESVTDPGGGGISGYTLDVVYKREIRNP